MIDRPAVPSDIVGLLRFSMVLKTNRGFPTLVEHDYDTRCEMIFDADRMWQRLHLLEHMLVASLRAQSDTDFAFGVMITTNLPRRFRRAVEDLIAPIPQMFLVTVPPARFLRFGCRKGMEAGLAPGASRFASFRIDDDDALSVDYIARLRRGLGQAVRPTAMTFGHGLELAWDKNGRTLIQPDDRPYSGAGLALLSVGETEYDSVYQLGPHRKVTQKVPGHVDNGPAAFLRLLHDDNVSGAALRADVPLLGPKEANEALARGFGHVDLNRVRQRGPSKP